MSKVSIAAIGRIAARSRTSSKVAAPAPRLAAAAARTWGSATATRSASPMGQTSRAFHGTSGEQRTSGGGGGAGGEGMRWGSVSVAALVAACSVAGGQALLEEAGRTDIKTAGLCYHPQMTWPANEVSSSGGGSTTLRDGPPARVPPWVGAGLSVRGGGALGVD